MSRRLTAGNSDRINTLGIERRGVLKVESCEWSGFLFAWCLMYSGMLRKLRQA